MLKELTHPVPVSDIETSGKIPSAKEWIVTHHDPKQTDKDILAECYLHLPVQLAFDGMKLLI